MKTAWRSLLFGTLALASACGAAPAPAPPTSASAGPRSARAQSGALTVRLPARIVVSDARAVVAAPAPARVVRVRVRPGDRVEAGAVLIEVVMPEVLAAAADLVSAQARLSAWERRVAQLVSLREAGLGRASDEAEAEIARADAVASRARSTAALRAAGLRPDSASALLEAGTVPLRSPRAGVVAELGAVEGEVVAEGHALGVVVADVAPWEAVRIVARAVSPPGGGATLSLGGRTTTLRALAGVARVQGSDGARELWYALESAPEAPLAAALVDGALATVEVRVEGGAAVPAAAVILEPDGAHVALLQGGAATPRDVIVRGRTADGALVVEGVSAGDEVSLAPRAVLGAAP